MHRLFLSFFLVVSLTATASSAFAKKPRARGANINQTTQAFANGFNSTIGNKSAWQSLGKKESWTRLFKKKKK